MTYKKMKGHIMIDVLFSIVLVGLIATFIIPNLYTLLENNERAKEKDEFVNYVQSNFEEIIAKNYHYGEIKNNFDEDDRYELTLYNEKIGDLNKVILHGKNKADQKEIQFEIYLWDEGIFSD